MHELQPEQPAGQPEADPAEARGQRAEAEQPETAARPEPLKAYEDNLHPAGQAGWGVHK